MTVVPPYIPPTPIDLKALVMTLGQYWPKSDKIDTFSAKLAERPAQNTLIILGLAAVLFYYAEREENPKVNTIYDALEYCSSSLSVGYTSIFPQTPMGKIVATLLMTYGPALSGAMLEGPKEPAGEGVDLTQTKILATLEQILSELKS
ncbi:MAG TPA: ion channel [Phycisphaerae bacterium]|jgi:hypothetical protein